MLLSLRFGVLSWRIGRLELEKFGIGILVSRVERNFGWGMEFNVLDIRFGFQLL